MPGVATYKYLLVADFCASVDAGAANIVQGKSKKLTIVLEITFMAIAILRGNKG